MYRRCRWADRGGAAAAVGPVRPEHLPLCHTKYQPRPLRAAPHTAQRVLLEVSEKVHTHMRTLTDDSVTTETSVQTFIHKTRNCLSQYHNCNKYHNNRSSYLSHSLSCLSVCSYRPRSPFLRARLLMELCDPTERAPCWLALDEQSPSTAIGEMIFVSLCRYIKGFTHNTEAAHSAAGPESLHPFVLVARPPVFTN